MSQAQQPEALRLADALAYCDSSVAAQAARELRTQHARIAELEQPQAALAAVPDSCAMVPKRLTRAMEEVLAGDGWQWEELLAAANAVSESDYEAISRGEITDAEIKSSFDAYGVPMVEGTLKAVREILGNTPAHPAEGVTVQVAEPVETVRYWLNAYSSPESGEHFQGHGMVVKLLRDYLALLAATPAAAPKWYEHAGDLGKKGQLVITLENINDGKHWHATTNHFDWMVSGYNTAQDALRIALEKAGATPAAGVPSEPTDAQIAAALKAACFHDTKESRKDMRAALIAAGVPAAAPVARRLLGKDHNSMRVDYSGLLGQVGREIKRSAPGHAEMLRQLQCHLKELGQGWYAGKTEVVDEFLQLYCVESEARAAIAAQAGKGVQ